MQGLAYASATPEQVPSVISSWRFLTLLKWANSRLVLLCSFLTSQHLNGIKQRMRTSNPHQLSTPSDVGQPVMQKRGCNEIDETPTIRTWLLVVLAMPICLSAPKRGKDAKLQDHSKHRGPQIIAKAKSFLESTRLEEWRLMRRWATSSRPSRSSRTPLLQFCSFR